MTMRFPCGSVTLRPTRRLSCPRAQERRVGDSSVRLRRAEAGARASTDVREGRSTPATCHRDFCKPDYGKRGVAAGVMRPIPHCITRWRASVAVETRPHGKTRRSAFLHSNNRRVGCGHSAPERVDLTSDLHHGGCASSEFRDPRTRASAPADARHCCSRASRRHHPRAGERQRTLMRPQAERALHQKTVRSRHHCCGHQSLSETRPTSAEIFRVLLEERKPRRPPDGIRHIPFGIEANRQVLNCHQYASSREHSERSRRRAVCERRVR